MSTGWANKEPETQHFGAVCEYIDDNSWNVAEFADILGSTHQNVYQLLSAARVVGAARLGGVWRIPKWASIKNVSKNQDSAANRYMTRKEAMFDIERPVEQKKKTAMQDNPYVGEDNWIW